jgi:serine/threonine protein phosphatase PrpC
MTSTSKHSQMLGSLEVFDGLQNGERPSRAHDYVIVVERALHRCALVVGRELRDDWDEREAHDTPAAAHVLAHADELFLPLAGGSPAERLDRFRKGFLKSIHRSQRELQQGAKGQSGEAPALTLTLAYVDGTRLYLGHVGDDRCYLMRGRGLHRMTTDHTAASPSSDLPRVNDPMLSRKLLNVVGGFSDDLEAETLALNLQPNDIILLCTPGIGTQVPEPTIQEILHSATHDRTMSLEVVANALFRAVPEHLKSMDRSLALARLGGSGED